MEEIYCEICNELLRPEDHGIEWEQVVTTYYNRLNESIKKIESYYRHNYNCEDEYERCTEEDNYDAEFFAQEPDEVDMDAYNKFNPKYDANFK